MESITQEFRTLLGECQDIIDKSSFQDDWTPKHSRAGLSYNCMFVELRTGAKVEENDAAKKSVWVALKFRITDGEFAGREFSVVYTTKAPWAMGPLFSLASMLANDPSVAASKSLLRCVEVLEPFKNSAMIDITVKTKVNTKNGTERAEYQFNRVLDLVA